MSRTLQDVQVEYQQQCSIIGDIEYRIRIMEVDKGRMMKRLKELNKEATRLSGKEQPEVAEVPSESTES